MPASKDMTETNIRQKIEQIVSEIVDRRVGELRAEITQAVAAQVESAVGNVPLPAAAAEPGAPGGAGTTDVLNAAVMSVLEATAQSEILRTLLDGCANFAARCALFVTRGSNLAGWQSRNFEQAELLRTTMIDHSAGLVGRVMRDQTPASAAAAEFDSNFVSTHGNPSDGNALLLPLIIKGKVAAVIYSDRGTGADGVLDGSALQVLVRSASLWIEILGLRKAGLTPADMEQPAPVAEASAPKFAASAASSAAAAPAPSADEQFGAAKPGWREPPEYLKPEAAPAEPAPAAVSKPEPVAEAAAVEVAAPVPPAPVPAAAAVPAADDEVHKKAKRFAKLLVDEIKLYNQKKVAEGRAAKDLYDRLREDIDKSRASYEKRYGQTAAAGADYFTSEVIRILADNDRSLLGENFPQ